VVPGSRNKPGITDGTAVSKSLAWALTHTSHSAPWPNQAEGQQSARKPNPHRWLAMRSAWPRPVSRTGVPCGTPASGGSVLCGRYGDAGPCLVALSLDGAVDG
jgi:hypothetical protein